MAYTKHKHFNALKEKEFEMKVEVELHKGWGYIKIPKPNLP